MSSASRLTGARLSLTKLPTLFFLFPSAARASVKKLPNPGVSMRLILVLFHSA